MMTKMTYSKGMFNKRLAGSSKRESEAEWLVLLRLIFWLLYIENSQVLTLKLSFERLVESVGNLPIIESSSSIGILLRK